MITSEDIELFARANPLLRRDLEDCLNAQSRTVHHPIASAELMGAYGAKPALALGEMVAIIQGLTPPVPSFGDEGLTYSDENAAVVQRLLNQVKDGSMACPCRPHELLDWAREHQLQLPAAFESSAVRGSRKVTSSTPCNPAEKVFTPAPHAARGDPRGFNQEWQELADAEAKAYRAKRKTWPTRLKVAEILHKELGIGSSTGRVERVIRCSWNPTRRGRRESRN